MRKNIIKIFLPFLCFLGFIIMTIEIMLNLLYNVFFHIPLAKLRDWNGITFTGSIKQLNQILYNYYTQCNEMIKQILD